MSTLGGTPTGAPAAGATISGVSASPGPLRAVLIDAQPMFRAGLRCTLEGAGHSVLGEAACLEDALPLLERDPNLLLIREMTLPDALDILRDVAAAGHTVRTLVIVPDGTTEETAEAVRLGVMGLVPPTVGPDLLRRCLDAVAAGEFWIRRDRVAPLLLALRDTPAAAPRPYGLTQRELDVVLAVIEGLSNREIATKLMIREDTVKHHLSAAFDKTGTFSRVELAVFAMNHRIGTLRRSTA